MNVFSQNVPCPTCGIKNNAARKKEVQRNMALIIIIIILGCVEDIHGNHSIKL